MRNITRNMVIALVTGCMLSQGALEAAGGYFTLENCTHDRLRFRIHYIWLTYKSSDDVWVGGPGENSTFEFYTEGKLVNSIEILTNDGGQTKFGNKELPGGWNPRLEQVKVGCDEKNKIVFVATNGERV